MFRPKAGDSGVDLISRLAAVDASLTALQLSLAAYRIPLLAHWAFNAAAAAGMVLLGHPYLAAWLFLGACAIDTINHRILKRWMSVADDWDQDLGLRRLAILSTIRVTIYTLPTFVMAIRGGVAELMFLGVQLATLVCVAMGAGALSQRVFWGFVIPMLSEVVVFVLLRFDPLIAAGLLLNAAIMTVVGTLVATSAGATIHAWHTAFLESIAERKAADAAREAARQASRARSNFLATMSHEIRTPMNGVLGMAELLRHEERDPVQIGRLDVLMQSGEYLMSILNDILDMSKIDAGKLEIVTAPEDLQAFLAHTIEFWRPRAAERGLDLRLRIAADAPACVHVDGLRLRQALFNLIGNAIKFTESGTVEVAAQVTSHETGRVALHLSVRDSGPGIAPQYLPGLFDRFSQAEEPETRHQGGTGLGLSIVSQLAELMGGRAWVESVVGVGSTFHIEVLAGAETAAPQAVAPSVDAGEPQAASALRILAVDDNAVNLVVLEQLLAMVGHGMVKATSGAEALELMSGAAFDVVLADVHMPRMSGAEMLRRLRASPGPNQQTPVIALTADVMSGDRQRYVDDGFADLSSKPIQIQDLREAIAHAAAGHPRAERAA